MNDLEKVIKGLKCCELTHRGAVLEESCNLCPYQQNKNHTCEVYELLFDARQHLKEQEPRLLTLEDIKTVGDSEPVYIETKISEKVNPAIFQPECSDGEYACVISSWSKSGFYSFNSYYRDWRCWSLRPTDEQRGAVPWDD